MTTPLRVLIIEDSEDDALFLKRELSKNGYELESERVETAEEMRTALARQKWDIIISDFVMPRFSGLDALQVLKENGSDIPFVIVSGKIGEETAVEAMKAGAHDYILKNNLVRLLPAVKREIMDAENRIKRRQAELELEQLHATLEARVVDLVAEQRCKDKILAQQSRLAAMGEMIDNIAHQWRQPLNNISLIIQDIQLRYHSDKLTAEEMDQDIREAMDVIIHMSSTINDFRNFFREDKEKKSFLVNKAVCCAVTMLSASLKKDRIKVKVEADDEVTILGYQNEYAQVLLNILSNSRDSAIERSIHHPLILIHIARENDRSVLYLRDNCGGIPDDVMPHIFDPYFTTRSQEKGSGIGLYMSKTIIEQNMGGHLTARNIDGGAEFRIEV